MFSFKRRDDFEETKSDLIFLDLSETLILTKEDLDKTLSKIPNLKLKADPIDQIFGYDLSDDSIKGHSLHSHRNVTKTTKNDSKRTDFISELSSNSSTIQLLNPIPEPMTKLDLNDFCGTDIDWKMLTLLRPKTPLDEQYFSKLVELYQLRHKTRIEDGFGVRETVFRVSRHPRVMRYKPISFTRMDSFCLDTHSSHKIKEDVTYEAFARIPIETQNESVVEDIDGTIDEILKLTDSLDFKMFQN